VSQPVEPARPASAGATSGATFADHFSAHAAEYAAFRPKYPVALFHWLAMVAPGTQQAWDAGTGNGQVAMGLVTRFARVVASDASAEQVANAVRHPRITYEVTSYQTGIAAGTAQLVTVGQAIHWFDLDPFLAEVRRVLQPGGVLAAFAYGHSRVSPEVDEFVRQHHDVTLGRYWPPPHRLIHDGYRSLALPIDELLPPPLEIREEWTVLQYIGFLRTWSATQRYLREHGPEGIALFEAGLRERWGAVERRPVSWPLVIRAGEVR
jgi:SAM-dependent methyltransferase